MITISHLSKSLGKKEVLNDISWQLEAGKVYGLVGPNGAGKSTLLRLIAGIYQPDTGSIEIDGSSVYENATAKKHLSFVSDDPFFLHRSTIHELKTFYHIQYDSFNDALYDRLVQAFGIDAHQRIDTFSKGMKRQAAIIIAMSVSAHYLLLDEAFDGLDPVMRLTLKQAIADEILNRKLTVLISSHNIRELEDIADELTLIQNGSITVYGAVDTIKNTYHKYQLAFTQEVNASRFEKLNTIYLEHSQKFVTLIAKGDGAELRQQLQKTEPLLLEELPLSMEEIFVYEMKEHGYGK